jgi:hypothetical protein
VEGSKATMENVEAKRPVLNEGFLRVNINLVCQADYFTFFLLARDCNFSSNV